MKIIVKRNEQLATVTIDISNGMYPYAIREAIVLALEQDGHTKDAINQIFNYAFEDPKIVEGK